MLLVLSGDRQDNDGYETGAQLYRGDFAGWDVAQRIEADAWMRPLRFTVIDGYLILADGYVDPSLPIPAGEAFVLVVPPPSSGGGRAITASLTTD